MSSFSDRLTAYIRDSLGSFEAIPGDRKSRLIEVARFVEDRLARGSDAALTFICTHNSRRSHMAQIWAQTAASFYSVPDVLTFSGGTEATALNPRAVAALRRAGFNIEKSGEGENPIYSVRYSEHEPAMEVFSKVYSSPPNPQKDFCAVMTCSDADANCPVVFGSAQRVSIPYEDPKAFDGTEEEAPKYEARCRQISREMLYLFSQVNQK